MAVDALPAEYLKAGEDYLAALQKLGLRPEFLGWGQQVNTREWWLVMVTSVLEIGGPLVLGELLFKAYNMNATPKEISPFIVQVFGPRSQAASNLRALRDVRSGGVYVKNLVDQNNEIIRPRTRIASLEQSVGDIELSSKDAYVIEPVVLKHEARVRQWSKFKSNIEKLAA